VWVIDPERRLVRVYRHDGTQALVSATETLSGDDLLPGFTCPLNAIV
jgi:Uma2 family endonuclease